MPGLFTKSLEAMIESIKKNKKELRKLKENKKEE